VLEPMELQIKKKDSEEVYEGSVQCVPPVRLNSLVGPQLRFELFYEAVL